MTVRSDCPRTSKPIYSPPLEQIIERHKTQCHFYADDTKLYLSFDPRVAQSTLARINICVVHIQA